MVRSRSRVRVLVLAAVAAALLALAGGLALTSRGRTGAASAGRSTPGERGATGGEVPEAPEEPAPLDPATAARVGGTVREASIGDPVAGGAPVAGAAVVFEPARGAPTRAIAGADGRFEADLAPGRYRVRATGEGLHGLAIDPLVVGPLARASALDLAVLRLATVEGRTIGPDGAPLAGVTVIFAARTAQGDVGSRELVPPETGRSGPDGAFTLRVPPGEVRLLASAPGARGTARLADVAPGARVADVAIALEPAAAVGGVVLQPDGRAAKAGQVTVRVRDAAWALAPRVAGVGPDGRWQADDLPAGPVEVLATAPGHAPSATLRLELAAGARQERVGLRLGPSAAVAGRVLGPDGRPANGVRVVARAPGGGDEILATATEAAGAFVLAPVGVGPFEIVAEAAGLAPARRAGVGAPAEGIELRLGRRGGLAGLVRTARGAPALDFTLTVVRFVPVGGTGRPGGPGARRRILSADGTYRLDGLEPGTYDLGASAPGHAPSELRDVVVPPGGVGAASVVLAGP